MHVTQIMEQIVLSFGSLTLLLSFFAADAHALSCRHGFTDSIPSNHALDVPTNVAPVLLFAGGSEETELTLTHIESGRGIDFSVTPLGSKNVLQIQPMEELLPNTKYALGLYNQWYQMTGDSITFTTGSSADTTAPKEPKIIDIQRDFGRDYWGSWKWLDIELESSNADGLYRIEVADNEAFDNSEVIYVDSYDSVLYVGRGLCDQNMKTAANDVKWVRVSAIDLAGNQSDGPEAYASGCSSVSQPANPLLLLLTLPLLVFRRREGHAQMERLQPHFVIHSRTERLF